MTPRPRQLVLLPAVDVASGQAVRLVQGKEGTETAYGSPIEAAHTWVNQGAEWIHLVDLDAAFGRGSNAGLLAEVVREVHGRVHVELSGGIRDDESLAKALAQRRRVEQPAQFAGTQSPGVSGHGFPPEK